MINQDKVIQDLLHFIADMIVNYTALLAFNPDIYPNMMPQLPSEGI